MCNSTDTSHFSTQLLQQDQSLKDSEYKEYRMKLKTALATAEHREKLAGRVAMVSIPIAFILMFVGASQIFGPFDPTEKDANVVSMGLSVIYVIAVVVGPISLASYYSRFRPRVIDIQQKLRDANMLAIKSELAEIRKEFSKIVNREKSH